MKILLDTHLIIWALTNSPSLSDKAKKMILDESNDIYFSVISLWEITLKRLAKPEKLPITAQEISNYCLEAGFRQLVLNERSIFKLSELNRPDNAPPHKDPFDRLLICQAISEDMILLTHDSLIADYDIRNIILV